VLGDYYFLPEVSLIALQLLVNRKHIAGTVNIMMAFFYMFVQR
jgi:hypothetical protein